MNPRLILGVVSGLAILGSFIASADHSQTITVLSGDVKSYYIVQNERGTLDMELRLRIDPDSYEQLGKYDNCLGGCRLRIHIVQIKEPKQ